MKKITAQSWSNLWDAPTITTFGGDFEGNYDGTILEFWEAQLQGEFNHVIDLACGNGALTWIANDVLNGGETKTAITGIDFANITPFKTLKREEQDFPEVTFIGNTNIENLPFEDSAVDLVMSQYGLEYSDLDKSIPEISRVLSATGKMSFILHDRSGALVRGAIHPLDDYKMLRNVIRFDELILELGEAHEKCRHTPEFSQTEEYRKLVDKVETTRGVFQSIIDKFPQDTPLSEYKAKLELALLEAPKLPAKRQADLNDTIAEAREVLRMAIERKEDLIVASLTKKQLKHLIALIKKEGFTITDKRILEYKRGLNWGTMLVAKRAPSNGGLFGFLRRLITPPTKG